MKDWLPITVRNRVALGFAFAALVMFVTWNFLPYQSGGEDWLDGTAAMNIWPQVISPSSYIILIGYLGYLEGAKIAVIMVSLIHSGLIVLVVVPFWRMLHASTYVRLCLAIMNLAGACATLFFVFESLDLSSRGSMHSIIFVIMALSMLALSAALFIFKNELGLRNEQEVEKTMNGE